MKTKFRMPSLEGLQYFSMAAPASILFIAFMVIPVIGGIYFSFTDWTGLNPHYHFVGFKNFKTFFHDMDVLVPLRISFVYAFVLTLAQNIASLAIALALNQNLKTKNLLRTLWFVPVLVSPLLVGYLWNFLFSGPVAALGKSLGINVLGNNILGSTHFALYAAIFVDVWRMLGWNMVIYIAALQSVPKELIESAIIDGASRWRQFRHITFPLIAAGFTISMIATMERGFKEFDLLFSLTGGGPGNATEVFSLAIYRESFEYFRAGYGNTMGVVLFVIIIVITIIQMRVLRKREENAIS